MKIKIIVSLLILCGLNLEAKDTMTLNKAVELALKNNLDLQIAGNTAQQAHNNNHSGNAGMLPTVSLNVADNPSLTNINQKFTNGTTIERNNVFSNSLSAGLVFSYTLYDGSKMFATRKKLEFLDQAAANTFNIQIQQVISNVIFSYSNINRQSIYLAVLTQLEDLSRQRLEIVQARQIAGLANNTDLYFAQLDLDSRRQNVVNQEALIKNAYTAFNVLLNNGNDTSYSVEVKSNSFAPLLKSDLDSMLKNNPEWMLVEDQYNIALQASKEIASARLPLVRLNGAYNYNLSQSQAGFSLYNQSSGPQAGLTLSIPLFSGNVNRSNIQNAKLDIQSSEWRKEQTIQNIRSLYEQSWQDYSTALKQLTLDSVSIHTAKNYMDLMQLRFQNGQSTIIELKEAQRIYEETYYRFINNQYVARVAETQLLGLTGQLVRAN